ncbi:hypothetical protein C8R43DRAFT_1202095 [Mycena crocata]|nr:hypothetical protein C8R43DRAFT_1202095 [Mycena crocata]
MSGIPDEDGINSSWREQRARGTEGICGQCNLCCYTKQQHILSLALNRHHRLVNFFLSLSSVLLAQLLQHAGQYHIVSTLLADFQQHSACHFDNVKIQHGTVSPQALSTALEPVHRRVTLGSRRVYGFDQRFTANIGNAQLDPALRSSSSRRRHQLISSPTTEWRYGLAAAGSLSHYALFPMTHEIPHEDTGGAPFQMCRRRPKKFIAFFVIPRTMFFVQGSCCYVTFATVRRAARPSCHSTFRVVTASAFKLNVAQCRADRRRGAPLRIFFLQFLEFPQAGIIFKVLNSRPGRAAEARSADTANFIQVFVWFLDITTCEVSYSLPRISGFPLSGLTRQSDLNTQGGGAAALQKIRSLYAPPPPENNVASVDGAERRPPNFDSMFGLPANKVTRCSFNDPARNANLIFGVPASGRLRAQLSTTPRFNQVKNAPNQLPLAQLPFKNEHIDLAISNIFAFNNAFLHASSWISSSPNSRTRRMFNFSLTTRQEFNYNNQVHFKTTCNPVLQLRRVQVEFYASYLFPQVNYL